MSYKGSSWKKHKYTKKENGKYYYRKFINEHKKELAKEIEEASEELGKNVREVKKDLNKTIRDVKATNIEIDTKPVEKRLKKEKDKAFTPERFEKGKEVFDNAYKKAKNVHKKLTKDIENGAKKFDSLIRKYF